MSDNNLYKSETRSAYISSLERMLTETSLKTYKTKLNAKASETLVARIKKLHRGYRLRTNSLDSEDCRQEVFLRLSNPQKPEDYFVHQDQRLILVGDRLEGTIYRTAQNLLNDWYRGDKQSGIVTEDYFQTETDTGTNMDQENQQYEFIMECVRQHYASQPGKAHHVDIFERKYATGDSDEVLCKEFEVSRATLYRILKDVKNTFKRCRNPDEEMENDTV